MKSLLSTLLRRCCTALALAIVLGQLAAHVRPAFVNTSVRPGITISGDIEDLHAGAPGRLLLALHNEAPTAAVVHRITVSAREHHAGCSLTARPWTGSLSVPAGATASREVPVQVDGPDCAGRSWTLDYTASE